MRWNVSICYWEYILNISGVDTVPSNSWNRDISSYHNVIFEDFVLMECCAVKMLVEHRPSSTMRGLCYRYRTNEHLKMKAARSFETSAHVSWHPLCCTVPMQKASDDRMWKVLWRIERWCGQISNRSVEVKRLILGSKHVAVKLLQ